MKDTFGRKLYSISETYTIVYNGIRSIPLFTKARKNNIISEKFSERIMIATTEVNGCSVCSYAHTKIALESGMDNDEIKSLLMGDLSTAPTEELPAIIFAQHYADSRGNPTEAAQQTIIDTYGMDLARVILAAIRIITIGNVYGIPFGSLKSRFSKNKDMADGRSDLPYEIIMMLSALPFFLIGTLHAIIMGIVHKITNNNSLLG